MSPASTTRSRAARRRATSRCSTGPSTTSRPSWASRTWSTSAAATRRTCSRSGASTASIGRCGAPGKAGTVMTGQSAGSLCWFETGTTDSFGKGLAALSGGLGFVPGSHAPHYDSEATRRPHYERLVAEGVLPAGYAADDGAALVFHGGELAEVVAARPNARAYRVERGPDGTARRDRRGDPLPGLIRLDRAPSGGRARPTSRRLGPHPVPRRSRAGGGRSRPSRPSRAARGPERCRPAAPARTGGPRPPGGAPRAAWRPSPDRGRRRRTGRRPAARPRSATARRRGGRGRARGDPSDVDAGDRRSARAP